MSAEIPGSTFDRADLSPVTDLVEKILVVTGHAPDVAAIYGYRIGSYASEVTLTALKNAGLLTPDFTMERFSEAVGAIDKEMNIDEWAAETRSRRGRSS